MLFTRGCKKTEIFICENALNYCVDGNVNLNL